MVAFISRYCAMAIIEVDVLSQYSDVHGSRELVALSVITGTFKPFNNKMDQCNGEMELMRLISTQNVDKI